MLANLDKFQATAVHHNKNINEIFALKVNNNEFESKNLVKISKYGT